ncbi:hypothetical protein SynRS9909_01314 [Synechococcus sp. RS9909]|uniref:hypothetical protein n=1 Tax=unclassified Synechococcus TaxID=2626047 RepID=UPI000068F830|nr:MULTISPECIES: hypothetical protein [unclassified Synechococcus]EAQ69439.1 hypothetical protein RS9917_13385 [Synechococcus sp. RS9917]QNI79301.1 hypothetical protein SynRS9909_01314 [Synechococcus sp. RS9909]
MDQVLRIVFCNGQVAERRGEDDLVAALFAADAAGLIDYVLALEVDSGRCFFFTRPGDQRFDGETVLKLAF